MQNDVGDDWFYDDYDPQPLEATRSNTNTEQDCYEGDCDAPDMNLMEFEWMEELKKIHEQAEDDRLEEEAESRRSRAAYKAAQTRKLNRWKKEDEERRLRRGRHFRSIDDPMETT